MGFQPEGVSMMSLGDCRAVFWLVWRPPVAELDPTDLPVWKGIVEEASLEKDGVGVAAIWALAGATTASQIMARPHAAAAATRGSESCAEAVSSAFNALRAEIERCCCFASSCFPLDVLAVAVGFEGDGALALADKGMLPVG